MGSGQQEAQTALPLADRLAIDRTVMANERTLLSYVRTGLAPIVVGGSLLKFFDSWPSRVVSGLFLASGSATLVVGWSRFRRVRRRLAAVGAMNDEPPRERTR